MTDQPRYSPAPIRETRGADDEKLKFLNRQEQLLQQVIDKGHWTVMYAGQKFTDLPTMYRDIPDLDKTYDTEEERQVLVDVYSRIGFWLTPRNQGRRLVSVRELMNDPENSEFTRAIRAAMGEID